MKKTIVLSALMLSVTGCPPAPQMPPPSPAQPPSMRGKARTMTQRGLGSASASNAAAANVPVQFQVELYQLSVPFGTVSRNEQFWKRVDEQSVDVATYDVLFKNGIRVGLAPIAEWDYFRRIMAQHPTFTKANTLVGVEGRPVELPMRKDVRSQEIFYFDASGELQGSSFDQSENVITMSFQPAPRKPQTMRIALCPVVRATRKHLEYSSLNNEMGELKYTASQRLYDMNLRTDVPVDQFLIVAPSPQSTWPTSIGNAFLVNEGAAEKMETVLLIVPKSLHLEESQVKSK